MRVAQRVVSREGEVEPLAEPVRVDAHEPSAARRARPRPTNPARVARCARRCPRCAGRPGRGTRERLPTRFRRSRVFRRPATLPHRRPRCPTARASPAAHVEGLAPAVSTLMTARSPSTSIPASVPRVGPSVGERHGHLVAANVVRIGHDAAVADHDARAALPRADADDRRPGHADNVGDGRLQILDDTHVGCAPHCAGCLWRIE